MIRRVLFAAIIPTAFAACSDDAGTITPVGPHHHYVVNKATVPKNSTEARMYGLDVDGKAGVDNQLGMVLGTLATQGFKIQDSIDLAVADGTINLLVNVQSEGFAGASGVQVHLGKDAKTSTGGTPCEDQANPTVATCGKQLDGKGQFTVDGEAQAAIAGTFQNGVFAGGGVNNEVSLKISLAGATVELDLIGAKAQLTGVTETGITSGIVAGAVSQDDLNTKVIPAIQSQLGPLIMRDCTKLDMPTAMPACGCPMGSTGGQIVTLFDTAPKDCSVSVEEIKTNGIIMSLLAPDVVINNTMALSIGLGFTATGATYTVPGE